MTEDFYRQHLTDKQFNAMHRRAQRAESLVVRHQKKIRHLQGVIQCHLRFAGWQTKAVREMRGDWRKGLKHGLGWGILIGIIATVILT
jgi:hypothetical protein